MADASQGDKALAHENIGWSLYEDGQYAASIEASRKSLELDRSSRFSRANLALALLHNGETDEGLSEYASLAKMVTEPEELESDALDDLVEAKKKRPDLPGLDEALAILQQLINGRKGA